MGGLRLDIPTEHAERISYKVRLCPNAVAFTTYWRAEASSHLSVESVEFSLYLYIEKGIIIYREERE